jgi:hypothetical protein
MALRTLITEKSTFAERGGRSMIPQGETMRPMDTIPAHRMQDPRPQQQAIPLALYVCAVLAAADRSQRSQE